MNKLVELIEQTAGKIFTVEFVKKDGTIRKLNGRVGVKKFLAGGNKTVSDKYVTVYDMKNKGYRSVNKDTITMVKFNRTTYHSLDTKIEHNE
jgi:hypothetical protein